MAIKHFFFFWFVCAYWPLLLFYYLYSVSFNFWSSFLKDMMMMMHSTRGLSLWFLHFSLLPNMMYYSHLIKSPTLMLRQKIFSMLLHLRWCGFRNLFIWIFLRWPLVLTCMHVCSSGSLFSYLVRVFLVFISYIVKYCSLKCPQIARKFFDKCNVCYFLLCFSEVKLTSCWSVFPFCYC